MTSKSIIWSHVSLTRENIELYLARIERELLVPGQRTSTTWMGVTVEWVAGTKRDGNARRRGKAYGRIAYRVGFDQEEVPRAVAVEEVLKPAGLRRAEDDLKRMWECSICHALGIGFDAKRKWDRCWLNWARYENSDREVWVTLCPECLKAIASGKIKRELG